MPVLQYLHPIPLPCIRQSTVCIAHQWGVERIHDESIAMGPVQETCTKSDALAFYDAFLIF